MLSSALGGYQLYRGALQCFSLSISASTTDPDIKLIRNAHAAVQQSPTRLISLSSSSVFASIILLAPLFFQCKAMRKAL